MIHYNEQTRFYEGREIIVQFIPDDNNDPPWDQEDGHGPVSLVPSKRVRYATKRSGQMILKEDDGGILLYDFQKATKQAMREGWGLGINDFMRLTCQLRRCPTRKQVIREAVFMDFKRLHRFCHHDWWYIGVIVTDRETGIHDSLWGIESDATEYIEEVIKELAEGLYLPSVRALVSGKY